MVQEIKWEKWLKIEKDVRAFAKKWCFGLGLHVDSFTLDEIVGDVMMAYIEDPRDLNYWYATDLVKQTVRERYLPEANTSSLDRMREAGDGWESAIAEYEYVNDAKQECKRIPKKFADFQKTLNRKEQFLLDAMMKKVTSTEIAHAIGVTPAAISQQQKVFAKKVAKYFQVSVEQLEDAFKKMSLTDNRELNYQFVLPIY